MWQNRLTVLCNLLNADFQKFFHNNRGIYQLGCANASSKPSLINWETGVESQAAEHCRAAATKGNLGSDSGFAAYTTQLLAVLTKCTTSSLQIPFSSYAVHSTLHGHCLFSLLLCKSVPVDQFDKQQEHGCSVAYEAVCRSKRKSGCSPCKTEFSPTVSGWILSSFIRPVH